MLCKYALVTDRRIEEREKLLELVGGFLFNAALDAAYTGDRTTAYWRAGGLAAVSYALALVQPFLYQRRWNKLLRDRLMLGEETIREVKREEKRAALNPPALKIRPVSGNDLAVQLDLVSLSY